MMKIFYLALCLVTFSRANICSQESDQRIVLTRAFTEFVSAKKQQPEAFVKSHVAASLLKTAGKDELIKRLLDIQKQLQGSTLDDNFPDAPHIAGLIFARAGHANSVVLIKHVDSAPWGISDIWIEGGMHLDPDAKQEALPPKLTWENLEQRMALEVEAGFSGALLIARQGKVVHREGYGYANQKQMLLCTPKTIFASGSVPVDYTKAGILIMLQDELIERTQPITDFFDEVPEDKRNITIAHLMNGKSGLQDFHGIPSDADPDHHWIDRDEAVRRILGQALLFQPGRGEQHSHSAWGLLAAIIEIANDTTYQAFTREKLFEPAGMLDTGFNGDPVATNRLAVGYGFLSDGEVNAPPYWGRTSWLVLGSGGMTTTVEDMYRWQRALRDAGVFSPLWTKRYWSGPGVFAAGDLFGFEVRYSEAKGKEFVLLGNSVNQATRRRVDRLGHELGKLP